nr:1698_t:CDS:2 [Entrophospora candida]
MDLQQHIKHYLDNNEFVKWNLLGLLQYLATIIIYTNEDAIKFSDNLEAHRRRPEIKQFLINLDVKFAQDHYKQNVRKIILTDKTTAVVTSSEEFAKVYHFETTLDCQKKFSTSKDDISNQNLKNLSGNPVEIGNEEGDDDQKENDMVILFNFIKTHTLIEFLESGRKYLWQWSVLSETTKKICLEHSKFYNDDVIVNLNPKSRFFKQLSIDLIEEYNEELDTMTENLIPENLHNFLVKFFSERLSEDEWLIKIDDLICSNKNDKLMLAITRVIRRILPQFIKAFSLGPSNPLLNITSIERPHLNSFVHPCLESTLWNVARVNYEFGEIHFHSNLKREYADVYVEGSKPDAKDEKEVADVSKHHEGYCEE